MVGGTVVSAQTMNVNLDTLVENANSGVRNVARARRVALWLATHLSRFRDVDTDAWAVHARQEAISSRRGRKEIRRVILREWPFARELPDGELERLSSEFMGLLLLDPGDQSEARAEFVSRWQRAALAVVLPSSARVTPHGQQEDVPEIVDMTQHEFEMAAQAGLEKLGLTHEELAKQAASGEFQSQAARSLWVIIGGGYGE